MTGTARPHPPIHDRLTAEQEHSHMNVFVTGGTGLIGSAVVADLLQSGHRVAALARSDRSAGVLKEAGAQPVRGRLADVTVLRRAARQADGVVHLAAHEDLDDAAVKEEEAALAAMATALQGSGRPLALASGTPWIAGRAALESDPLPVDGPFAARQAVVTRTLQFADRDVRTTAVRIPRTAHQKGRGGFAGVVVDVARRTGTAGWVADGAQRWPAVHVLDAARLFRLALEQAEPATAWHAVQDEGVPMRDIAAVIGERLGLPVREVPESAYGALGPICALDQPASSLHTRRTLGWEPVHTPLLEDLVALRP